jgi:gliding motility-associated protein GldC
MRTSEIKFTVTLDDEKIPQSIQWEAADSGIEGKKDCNAIMLTTWDAKDHTTYRIDLWTKEMLIDDMKRYFYENLVTMADTYLRATNDAHMSKQMKKFAEDFAKENDLFKAS